MFNAEVLSKFPVIQHFPFGSLFAWTPDPEAINQAQSVHLANQPASNTTTTLFPPASTAADAPTLPPAVGTAAPWARATSMPAPTGPGIPYSKAPWAAAPGPGTARPTPAPRRGQGHVKARMEARTEDMRERGLYPARRDENEAPSCPAKGQAVSLTKAPWAGQG
jgi:serine/threonine-protein phosphatase 2A activator